MFLHKIIVRAHSYLLHRLLFANSIIRGIKYIKLVNLFFPTVIQRLFVLRGYHKAGLLQS